MISKTITEFGCRIIWRILQISEGVIRLDLRPREITPSEISIILHTFTLPHSFIIEYTQKRNAYKINSQTGVYGNVIIDVSKLYRQLKSIAYKDGKKSMTNVRTLIL